MTPHAHHPQPAAGRPVVISGTGCYLPARVLTNAELEKMVDTTDEWIVTRTGIRERHIAAEGEATSHMSAQAAKLAIERAGISPLDIEMIIVATVTPDMIFPNTACLVQDIIGAKNAFCYDLEAACSGFLYALKMARDSIVAGSVKTVLVIGGEKLSCVTDWQDRATCVLFGDGAGAAVVQAGDGPGRGIMSSVMGSDGALAQLLMIPSGGSRSPTSAATIEQRAHYMKMEGREVFKHAVRCMSDACGKALQRCGMTKEDVSLVIPHQANMRIISAIADRIEIGMDRFYVNLEKVGNMSSASVPVALDEVVRAGRVKKGDILLLVAFGGGFTWGATVVEW